MARSERTFDPIQIRKTIWWFLPICLAVIALGVWVINVDFIPSIKDLFALSPTVRVTAGEVVFPFFVLFLATMFPISIMRAVPVDERYVKPFESFAKMTAYIMFASVAFSAVVGIGQYYLMPSLGYSQCNILKGHPTLYFSDWVKDANLCIKGKTREWVREQAAKERI